MAHNVAHILKTRHEQRKDRKDSLQRKDGQAAGHRPRASAPRDKPLPLEPVLYAQLLSRGAVYDSRRCFLADKKRLVYRRCHPHG